MLAKQAHNLLVGRVRVDVAHKQRARGVLAEGVLPVGSLRRRGRAGGIERVRRPVTVREGV